MKLRQGNVFTPVCHSIHGGGGGLSGSVHAGIHPPGNPTPADGYCSGQYASYWNAFLFSLPPNSVNTLETRMHSSRMHTVCCSGRLEGVCIPACIGQGGVSQHVLGRGGVSDQGVSDKGGVSAMPLPYEQNYRRLWKRNFAATTLRTVIILTTHSLAM